ncbi:polyprotein [Vanilla mosaic virus]|uniref:Genome polyprotein n=2 Tax=Vanilla mosaic virus TaxID=186373 RepID=A0A1J0CNA6_9POTV|nr:polyprotein [Vanilla mosaic virus]
MACIVFGSFSASHLASAKVATGGVRKEMRTQGTFNDGGFCATESHKFTGRGVHTMEMVGVHGATTIIAPNIMAPIVKVVRPSATQINNYGRRLIKQSEDQVNRAFENFFSKPEMKDKLFMKRHAKLVRGRGQSWRLATPTMEIAKERQAAIDKEQREKQAFLAGEYDEDAICGGYVDIRDRTKKGEQVSFKGPYWRRTPKIKRSGKKVPQVVTANASRIERDLLRSLQHINTKIEYIGRKRQRLSARFVQAENWGRYVKIALPHEKRGKRVRNEINFKLWGSTIQRLAGAVRYVKEIHDHEVTPGWSGIVMDQRQPLIHKISRNGIFVIRGRLNGKLIDACEDLPWSSALQVHQYTKTPEEQFFQGWREVFTGMGVQRDDHGCTIDFTNEQCGQVAAAISQTMFPVKKLSCLICRNALTRLSDEEYKAHIATSLTCAQEILEIKEKELFGLSTVLRLVRRAVVENINLTTSTEIVRLTQNHTSTHMLQIQDINKALMKGSTVSQEDLDKASQQLLRMTQWLKKHLSLIGEGNLESFRNKRASKALLNPSLLCDNQLDKNGNFIWGERGYHSKRFFSNYFEEIVPTDGYSKYIIRRNPSGSRKLAIGSLIVPFNLERARIALMGEPIDRVPLTMACISRQDNNYVYTCCCVTNEDGTPMLSELRSPTKHHLVLGNTGDSKFVDLSALETNRLYIAKDGFCYMNIFLAMLINVNESEAKNFTKMVRDRLVPMLGEWPTVQDLATSMYILTVFHPETRSAELPRILVDHTTQTMHVIDSYGSLSTGYHILKAGTVGQFLQFAADDLKSEMKFYRVGGDAEQRMRCETALIKGIFKPKLMLALLRDDPYITLMGLVSPTILFHMFRMRSLEKGIELWINRNQEVGKIFIILEQLVKKMAMSDVLLDQLTAITNSAPHLLEIVGNCPKLGHAYKPAVDLLQTFVEHQASNRILIENGYSVISVQLYNEREKIFRHRLQQEWHALNWLEKCSLTLQQKKFSVLTENFLTAQALKDTSEFSRNYMKLCFTTPIAQIKRAKSLCIEKLSRAGWVVVRKSLSILLGVFSKCYSDIIYLVNVCIIFSLLVQMIGVVRGIVNTARTEKAYIAAIKRQEDENTIIRMYNLISNNGVNKPTKHEFEQQLESLRPDLLPTFSYMVADDIVEVQAKTALQLQFEKIIAFLAIVTMCIDSERSDAVFKLLSKLKTVFATVGENVRIQSLDDIENIEDCKNLTVDFEITSTKEPPAMSFDVHFEDWWSKQLQLNRVVPHYRGSGKFLEFTRATAAKVANEIVLHEDHEFLIRGAVGSGKSTGLPYHLAKKGRVLLLEPTRPLAENVSKQLAKDPFFQQVTLRMRGMSVFGSSNIVVMTSGFAFHYYVNNPHQLSEFDFVIIDECHVMDAPTIAFNCALKEFNFSGKLLKVSATPPGRECEFTTQFPVKLVVEEQLSFQGFVQAQGTQSNADMTKHGHNILVYVASYNDVDTLSRQLSERKFKVTKVDGRTMQMGNIEIKTEGVEGKPHFIVATNIIENGVTIDIDCVVDFGQKVVATLDSESRCLRYNKTSVSYGERIQRLGRVGRFKAGTALRVGHTERGIDEVPASIATEAAFLSFAYGLPVTTQGVTTDILSRCTVKQARVALNFELTPFFTVHFVRFDGSMHPEVHKLLKGFKLRESEMLLNKLAIPNQYVSQWISVKEYDRLGIKIQCPEDTRIPFYARGIPDTLFGHLWEAVQIFKSDAGFGRLSTVNASKISYTLSTDPHAIPRTIAIIDHLLSEEMIKKDHFDTIGSTVTGYSFSLTGIVEGIRKRYLKDFSIENIATLQQAKAQLLDINTRHINFSNYSDVADLGVLRAVQFQSRNEVCKFLGLKGKWDGIKFTNDLIVGAVTLLGGGWLIYEYFSRTMRDPVVTQGKKRQIQKLKFRDARDRKLGREIYCDDNTMEHTFGEAYTKKGKQKGSTHTKGMGKKNKNFVHIYGVEPENYSFIRFVDPLTGYTLDENPRADMQLIQEEIGKIRKELINGGELEPQAIYSRPGIEAYFINNNATEALKVDLTPHRPTLLQLNSNAIAGFPERENELRQTGQPVKIYKELVPKANEYVAMEGKSVYKGLRDYNSIATTVCHISNRSNGHNMSLYGIGYGSVVITNSHLFKQNNGTITINTWHGEFIIKNSTQLKIHHIIGKDMILIQMPKDFPPFARKSQFRGPKKEERVCMVGTNFQEKSMRATFSEASLILPEGQGTFWKHWISTNDGDCGIPMVAVSDGQIVGFHGLTSNISERNYFVPFTDDFEQTHLQRLDSLEWTQHWHFQPDKIAWGSLRLVNDQPTKEFSVSKLISDLFENPVQLQGSQSGWVLNSVEGNLKAVAQCESALVTKHTVKGPCRYFSEYLSTNQEAEKFFRPLMGSYAPSRLNREAFKKDFFKYAKPVELNKVDFGAFQAAVCGVETMMMETGFHECEYITDAQTIIDSLNMKAAVGAQYRGKKSEYFHNMEIYDMDRLLFQSCERLFYGRKGVWNGSLKAELRPIEKTQLNKTRTFTAAPLDTLLGAKTCVDDFNNQFYSLNLKCPWTVGMTKFYKGWDTLMRKLPDGWVYCHADGSQFDSSLTPLLINAVVDIRKFFMEEWWVGEEMLDNLYAEIIYTPILTPDGTIFKKFRGNNSGQPSTVVDNTLMVVISVYYSCIKQGWTEFDISQRIIFYANGDDIILAVQQEDETVLDTFQNSFAELGLNYDFSERTHRREDLWFMSHQAMKIGDVYIPKLEPERIVSILEWDRSKEIMHRTEAICAAMIEAWGHTDLLQEIRKFYLWLLEKDEFKTLASEGKAPYIAETALKKLYTDETAQKSELQRYWEAFNFETTNKFDEVTMQAGDTVDAGQNENKTKTPATRGGDPPPPLPPAPQISEAPVVRDAPPTETGKGKGIVKDVNAGTSGTYSVPRLSKITQKMNLPLVKGKCILNLNHLIEYKPEQRDIFNTRATHTQFEAWYNAVKREYELEDEQMHIVMNGFMVWCIDNGTSPDINGAWVMMDGNEQIEYPLKPIVENAKPTLRQIMHHFSDAAEAYIELRNAEKPYMPRYGLIRNLRDASLARYAFDFYEVNSKTPVRAREAVAQMKAAALSNVTTRLFGLDGNVSTSSENTERHTAKDVTPNMHTLLGMSPPQ